MTKLSLASSSPATPLAVKEAHYVGVSSTGEVFVELDGRRQVAICSAYVPSKVGERVLVVVLADERLALLGTCDPEARPTHARIDAAGDLVLRAPNGKIVLEAGESIELRATESLRIEAATVDATADAATLHVRDVSVIADTIRTTADEIATTVGRWELRARRIVERATDAVRSYQGLLHIGAGRVRTVVRENFAIAAKRTSITSQEDTVVDGKRVLLG